MASDPPTPKPVAELVAAPTHSIGVRDEQKQSAGRPMTRNSKFQASTEPFT